MRILIIDDHELFAEGLRLLLGAVASDRDVFVEITTSHDSAIARDDRETFELVLLDYYLPNTNSLVVLSAIKNAFTNSRVVIVSSEESCEIIYELVANGADGFIPKSSSKKLMLAALELVISGGTYLPLHSLNQINSRGEHKDGLTNRQREVISLVSMGLSNKQIGDRLSIAEGTVKAHLSAAFSELGVRNRTEAVLLMRDRNYSH